MGMEITLDAILSLAKNSLKMVMTSSALTKEASGKARVAVEFAKIGARSSMTSLSSHTKVTSSSVSQIGSFSLLPWEAW